MPTLRVNSMILENVGIFFKYFAPIDVNPSSKVFGSQTSLDG